MNGLFSGFKKNNIYLKKPPQNTIFLNSKFIDNLSTYLILILRGTNYLFDKISKNMKVLVKK
jgi:hypothetical protein